MRNGFKIAARALRQLGAELITSDDIALNELIKNSFDATSPRVEVQVSSPFKYPTSKLIKLAKDWEGTSIEVLDKFQSCLLSELSETRKKSLTEEFLDCSFDTYVETIEDLSRRFNYIKITDTGVGMSPDELRDNFLVVGTPVKWLKKKEDSSSALLGEKGVGRLSMMRLGRYSALKSGTSSNKHNAYIKFDWDEFDDPTKYLEDVEIQFNEEYEEKSVGESGTSIKISSLNDYWSLQKTNDFVNKFLRRLHNPFESKKSRFPIDVSFNGKRIEIERMHSWLRNSANFHASVDLVIPEKDEEEKVFLRKLKWHGKDTFEKRELSVLELTRMLECTVEDLRALGPIRIDCLWFNRTDWKKDTHEKSRGEFIEELNIWCGGFTLYRDSFRIGLTGSQENDWLKMDKSSLTSQGFTFNRYQTVGAISITQKNNPNLVDAANRESLIDSSSLSLLKRFMEDVVILDLKTHITVIKEAEEKGTVAKATSQNIVKESLKQLDAADESIKALKKIMPPEAREDLKEIREVIKFQRENVRVFQHAVKLATEQKVELLELASIGMVVEKVIHELARLTAVTADNLRELEMKGDQSKEQLSILKVIKEQMKVTNKRIRSVDILSPSGRNRKDKFNLVGLIETVFAGYEGRFTRHKVKASILVDGNSESKNYEVNMVVGLVAQIIENLLSNSLYWLQQGMLEGEAEAKIIVEIDTISRSIAFFDNGPGIAPEYAEEVFLPYYTTRPKGKGLGLFIARELANYHQAEIYVDKTPDIDGRLRCFILELPKGN